MHFLYVWKDHDESQTFFVTPFAFTSIVMNFHKILYLGWDLNEKWFWKKLTMVIILILVSCFYMISLISSNLLLQKLHWISFFSSLMDSHQNAFWVLNFVQTFSDKHWKEFMFWRTIIKWLCRNLFCPNIL